MEKLLQPVTRLWGYIETHYGFIGQIFFILLTILLILGVIYFVGNRGGGSR